MRASVIICTWNRAELLAKTLTQFCELNVPAHTRWELIVVDNGSTDETPAVLARFASRLPLRALREPLPGKSRAANRAIAAARGELLLWTDDDVLVSPQWLTAYLNAAALAPHAAFFGGPIIARFLETPPRWLLAAWPVVAVAYAERKLSELPHAISTACELPFGANMATRRAAHARFLFDTELGPTGTSQVRGEELDLLSRMLAAGHTGHWTPTAKVQHLIPAARATRAYLAGYFFGAGQQRIIAERHADCARDPSSSQRWRMRLKARWSEAKYHVAQGLFQQQAAMRYFRNAHVLWGQASIV